MQYWALFFSKTKESYVLTNVQIQYYKEVAQSLLINKILTGTAFS